MSSGLRVPARLGLEVAAEAIDALGPACERIEVAGSLRRKRDEVGDVEIVAVSRQRLVPSGLFFEADAIEWELDGALDRYVGQGAVERLLGKDRYTKLRHRRSGLQIDLFTVRPPAQWGVIYLIRTGPADYSHNFVTLIRRRDFHVREGALHRGSLGCGSIPCEVIPTPEERDVYAAVGLPYIQPEQRA